MGAFVVGSLKRGVRKEIIVGEDAREGAHFLFVLHSNHCAELYIARSAVPVKTYHTDQAAGVNIRVSPVSDGHFRS